LAGFNQRKSTFFAAIISTIGLPIMADWAFCEGVLKAV